MLFFTTDKLGNYGSFMGGAAKVCAGKEGFLQVFHDGDEDTYRACRTGENQGSLRKGVFHEYRCICMPASLSAEELEQKFRAENFGW